MPDMTPEQLAWFESWYFANNGNDRVNYAVQRAAFAAGLSGPRALPPCCHCGESVLDGLWAAESKGYGVRAWHFPACPPQQRGTV